ncbi:hypothetical protein JCM3775_003223 [Rhodotorula graminis]|uniref:Glycosyltransferase family 64 protein n=1 Tax=Rhodotorula graminis (strain WP1) TaxID=578459 RepID=A0A0P9FC83_RHOGW|nr:glycosyltransferase family 64 protein [Rhodotorula graminis WP1]KPV73291.1 glycosyltransferase family 64 protein [Rhodotorula graminis WP1]
MARVRVHRLAGVLLVLALVLAVSLALHRSSLSSSSPPLEPGCTLVVNVFSRPTTVAESVRHYAQTTSITAIVLLWAGPAQANETDLVAAAGGTRLSLVVPPSTSLNWRFYPWPEIRTDCVISMDDDWRMPHDHINRVSQVWHAGYRDRWVGFEHMGRNHVERDLADDGSAPQPVYAPTFWSQYTAKPAVMPPSKFHSIMLPSGAALSRKFFDAYHAPQWAAARRVVDELTNCEDLLMNYVVANLTGPRAGPAFVRAWHKPFQVDGLWFRPKHLGTRSECLQRFAGLTDTRLVYSDAYVPLDDAEVGVPPPDAYSYSTEIPFDLPCARPLFDREGICELVDSDAGWRMIGQPWIGR